MTPYREKEPAIICTHSSPDVGGWAVGAMMLSLVLLWAGFAFGKAHVSVTLDTCNKSCNGHMRTFNTNGYCECEMGVK